MLIWQEKEKEEEKKKKKWRKKKKNSEKDERFSNPTWVIRTTTRFRVRKSFASTIHRLLYLLTHPHACLCVCIYIKEATSASVPSMQLEGPSMIFCTPKSSLTMWIPLVDGLARWPAESSTSTVRRCISTCMHAWSYIYIYIYIYSHQRFLLNGLLYFLPDVLFQPWILCIETWRVEIFYLPWTALHLRQRYIHKYIYLCIQLLDLNVHIAGECVYLYV